MSVAEEIAKFAELRARGLITDAEFEQQKQAVLGAGGSTAAEIPSSEAKPHRQQWWVQTMMGVIGLVVMLGFLFSTTEVPRSLSPECASSEAREWLQDLLEGQHKKLLDLFSVSEIIYDPTNDIRYCQGTAILDSGTTPITFRFFPKSDKSQHIGQFSPIIPTAWGGVNPWVLNGEITEIQNRLRDNKKDVSASGGGRGPD